MQALILAGGTGTRFWPLSRRRRPKQLLALEGERSLLRTTFERLAPLVAPPDVWVCTTRELAAEIGRQLPEVPAEQILGEPEGRNTAPAIGWSISSMPPEARAGAVVVLPADHRIGDEETFRAALERARRAAEDDDRVLALGVTPRWVEPGYGYLELGETLDREIGLRRVVRFTEKPDRAAAERFVASGDYLWNAGIFVFRGESLLGHLRRLEPEIGRGLERIAERPEELDRIYPGLPEISIDHGVMEKLDELATVPLDCEWSDLGSWTALSEFLPAGDEGNAARGRTVAVDASDNLLWAEDGAIAVLGISGLVVVRTRDAVLVVPKERAQEVRRLVAELEKRRLDELL